MSFLNRDCADCGYVPCVCDILADKGRLQSELSVLRMRRIHLAQTINRIVVELKTLALLILPDAPDEVPAEIMAEVEGSPLKRCPACRTNADQEKDKDGKMVVYCPQCSLNTGPQDTMQIAKAIWQGLPRRKEG